MSARIIAQLLVQGISIFGRAFVSAYQQALHKGKAGGGPQAVAKAAIKFKMQPDEALKVLNIEAADLTKDILEERYKKLFEANDPGKGGSFYLQSKVYRSKEVLDDQFKEKEAPAENGSSANGSESKEEKNSGRDSSSQKK